MLIGVKYDNTSAHTRRGRGKLVEDRWQVASEQATERVTAAVVCSLGPAHYYWGRLLPKVAACLIFRIILVIIKIKIRNGQKTRSKLAEAAANSKAKRQHRQPMRGGCGVPGVAERGVSGTPAQTERNGPHLARPAWAWNLPFGGI